MPNLITTLHLNRSTTIAGIALAVLGKLADAAPVVPLLPANAQHTATFVVQIAGFALAAYGPSLRAIANATATPPAPKPSAPAEVTPLVPKSEPTPSENEEKKAA